MDQTLSEVKVMVFQKIDGFTKKVSDLSDVPSSTLSPSQIKSYFDTAPEELRVKFNRLVDDLGLETAASLLGAKDGSTLTTIQAQLDKLGVDKSTVESVVAIEQQLITVEQDVEDAGIVANNANVKSDQAVVQASKAVTDSAAAVVTSNAAKQQSQSAETKSDITQAQLNNIVLASGTSDAETIQARGGEDLLYKRLDKTDAQLADTVFDINSKGINVRTPPYNAKGDGTTDDYAIILQAHNDALASGRFLYFPTPTVSYLVSQKFIISQRVKWVGEKAPRYNGTRLVDGVVIEGHGINITGGEGHYFENLGVLNPNQANGFQLYGAIKDTVFNACITRSRDHGFLAESYGGEVSGVKVYKCKAYGGVHGFVSKSKYATFQLCEAYSCTGNGFVAVSDNIPGATQKGINLDNKFIECFAQLCGTGFIAYSRDMFSDTNANGISLSGLVIQACSAVSSTFNGFVIGDGNTAPAGTKYLPVYNTTIANSTHRGSTTSILVRMADGITIDGQSLEKEMNIDYVLAKNVNVGKVNSLLTDMGNFSDIELLPVNIGTPNVFSGRKIFKTANTGNTFITNMTGGKEKNIITIMIDDTFTTINNGGNFNLKRSVLSRKGSWIMLKLDGTTWSEIAGFQASGGTFGQNIVTTPILDIQKGSAFDAFGTGTTTNKITFTDGINPQEEVVTVLIRSSGGAFTYGGFDTTKFVVPSDLPLTVNFGIAVLVQWVYMAAVSKWICVGHRTSPYT
jgi:hypothetical protein